MASFSCDVTLLPLTLVLLQVSVSEVFNEVTLEMQVSEDIQQWLVQATSHVCIHRYPHKSDHTCPYQCRDTWLYSCHLSSCTKGFASTSRTTCFRLCADQQSGKESAYLMIRKRKNQTQTLLWLVVCLGLLQSCLCLGQRYHQSQLVSVEKDLVCCFLCFTVSAQHFWRHCQFPFGQFESCGQQLHFPFSVQWEKKTSSQWSGHAH